MLKVPPTFDSVHERLRGTLAAVVGIHHLRLALAIERLSPHSDRMADLQRDRDRCCGYLLQLAAIHDNDQAHKPFGHWTAGRI